MNNHFVTHRNNILENLKKRITSKEVDIISWIINWLISYPILLEEAEEIDNESMDMYIKPEEKYNEIFLVNEILNEIRDNITFVNSIIAMKKQLKEWKIIDTVVIKKLYEKTIHLA